MSWITLTILSSIVGAGHSVIDKRLTKNRKPHPLVSTASFAVVSLPIAAVGIILLPSIPWLYAGRSILAGALFVPAAWLYFNVVTKEDISRLEPLFKLSIMFKLLLARVFLGEWLTHQQLGAFGVILVSSILLTLKGNEAGKLYWSKNALWMVPVNMLLAVSSVLTTYVYRGTSMWHGIVWEKVGVILGTLICIALVPKTWRNLFSTTDRRTWGILIVEQSTRFLRNLAPSYAVASGVPLVLPSVLSSMKMIWVWVLATVWLKEPIRKQELLFKGPGILGMMLGMYWSI